MKIIAIDGPAGSGKSTVARHLAERLGLGYLDTGSMYRAVTYAVIAADVDTADEPAVARVARTIDLVIEAGTVMVDGVDATSAIRSPEVTEAVSTVAAIADVRSVLVAMQRRWVDEHHGGVIEGRDIGSVVFPEATLKLYITARPEVRAQRRAGELKDMDVDVVALDLARRDAADSEREASPLVQAGDARVVDNSDRSIDEVVDSIVGMLE